MTLTADLYSSFRSPYSYLAIGRYRAMAEEIAANQVTLEESGHWGVPTMVLNGEPFFRQDRIEMVEWRMEQLGLRRRG